MRRLAVLAVMFAALAQASTAEARIFGRRGGGSSTYSVPAGHTNATAQGTAEICASRGRLTHCGGHPGMFEGLGMARTKQAAYNGTCYANSGMRTVDVGYAQMKNGMWVCCRRFAR